jgi:hypothetical protein
MKLGEMRQELENYGISTKSFLEKSEMVDALQKARAEGKQPVKTTTTTATKNPDSTTEASSSSSSSSPNGGVSRNVRLQQEIEKANKMKIGELRDKLKELGISSKSFFEKTEFVKAYAEAVVDGVKQKTTTTSKSKAEDEKYDPSYRDVIMKKMDRKDQLLLQGTVIDIRLNR